MSSKPCQYLLGTIVAACFAFAGDAEDGPGRGVARISVLNGEVSIRRGDSGDYIAAAMNAPLVVEDRLLTGMTSRAELQFDWANFLRLSSQSEVRLAGLEYRRYQIQIAQGTVTFRVLRDSEADVELSTPSVSVRPVKKGEYRITVLDDGSSEITVRSGEADVFTPQGSERLKSGRTMRARGPAANPEFRVDSAPAEDAWDQWNERRDRDLQQSDAYRYLSRDIYGAEDLYGHGRWIQMPSYGWVWTPYAAAGWAPYRYGRWAWMDWYGWSWVSYDPWGWAPYHYGRWFYNAPVGWCWYPGSPYTRHSWAPALVAFVGFGGTGIHFGRVGWVPLAPFEPFHRWYGRGYYAGYRQPNQTFISTNIIQNVNVTNIYHNSRVPNAVTTVDSGSFGRGRGAGFQSAGSDLGGARIVQGPLPVAPANESLRVADRVDPALRSTRGDGSFYSRRPAPVVDRVPFEDQRRSLEAISRRPAGMNEEVRGTVPQNPPAGAHRPEMNSFAAADSVAGPAAPARDRGWRRIGQAAPPDAARVEGQNTAPAGEPGFAGARPDTRPSRVRSGTEWRRFGEPPVRSNGAYISEGNSPQQGQQPMITPGARTADRSENWRHFGAPGSQEQAPPAADNASAPNPGTVRSSSGDRQENWRRFGSGRQGDGAGTTSPATSAAPETRRRMWDFGPSQRRSAEGSHPAGEAPPSPPQDGTNSNRRERGWSERRSVGGGETPSAQPLRIAPDVVHQRRGDFDRPGPAMRNGGDAAPGGEAHRGDGGGNRGGRGR